MRNARRIRATLRLTFLPARSCSQILMTVQPCARKVRVTSRSRMRFEESFLNQKSAFPLGMGECFGFGQPCQKQPSTKTATRSRRNTRSGLPKIACRRLQPVIPCVRKSAIIRSSVSLLPLPRMRAMTSLRFSGVKTSGIENDPEIKAEAPQQFVRSASLEAVALHCEPACIARSAVLQRNNYREMFAAWQPEPSSFYD